MKTYVVSYLVQTEGSEEAVKEMVHRINKDANEPIFGLTVSRLVSAQRVRQVTGDVPTLTVVRPKRGKANDPEALRREIERLEVLQLSENRPSVHTTREGKIKALHEKLRSL